MKILVLLSVGVLLSTVSCFESYGECFDREFSKCAFQAFNETDDETCSGLKAQIECTIEAARECDMGFVKEAYKVQEVVNSVCTKETNEYLQRYRRCYGHAVGDGHCIKPIDKIMKGKHTLEENIQGQKEACMQVSWFKRCMVTNVEDTCGGVSEDYFSAFFDPLVALQKRICREVVFTMNENTSFLTVYGLPRVFEMIIEFFTEI